MKTIVTWLWRGERGYAPEHVNMLDRMLRRRMTVPYRLIVYSEELAGFDPGIDVRPIPEAARELSHLRTVEGPRFPTCFRRLWLFSEEAARELPDQIVMTDVDAVVTGCWATLFDYDDDFVGWLPRMSWGGEERLAGGMWLHRPGTMPYVWDEFVADPHRAMRDARAAGYRGSDQAWLSYRLYGRVSTWPTGAGVYSHREFTKDRRDRVVERIPDDARVVHFNGPGNAWDAAVQYQHPWLSNHWPAPLDPEKPAPQARVRCGRVLPVSARGRIVGDHSRVLVLAQSPRGLDDLIVEAARSGVHVVGVDRVLDELPTCDSWIGTRYDGYARRVLAAQRAGVDHYLVTDCADTRGATLLGECGAAEIRPDALCPDGPAWAGTQAALVMGASRIGVLGATRDETHLFYAGRAATSGVQITTDGDVPWLERLDPRDVILRLL